MPFETVTPVIRPCHWGQAIERSVASAEHVHRPGPEPPARVEQPSFMRLSFTSDSTGHGEVGRSRDRVTNPVFASMYTPRRVSAIAPTGSPTSYVRSDPDTGSNSWTAPFAHDVDEHRWRRRPDGTFAELCVRVENEIYGHGLRRTQELYTAKPRT
jgi:hypothetical protein